MTPRTVAEKILERDRLVARFGPDRSGSLVFTNGCYELLHPGHVACLQKARSLGDALVVGVNTDASARRLGKGPGRPFVAEDDRARLVAALEAVDAVCLFDEDTPLELIRSLRPDVLVKGADYRIDDVVGRDVVERAGGRVELVPLVSGWSTTELIQRMERTREEGGDD